MLDAVIARKPDAILIAPTDKVQLVEPLKKAIDAGIPVITVDTFIGTGEYQTRRRRRRFPALLHRVGQRARRPHRRARPRQGHRRQGQGLCLQREARRLDDRPARRRLQGRDEEPSGHHRARDPVQRRRRQQGRLAVPVGVRPQSRTSSACSAPICSRPSAPPTACSRPARAARSRSSPSTHPLRIVDNIKTGLVDIAIAQHPAEIGYYGVVSAYAHLTGQSIPVSIGTGFTVMDKTNVDDPNVSQLRLQGVIRQPARRRRADWSGGALPCVIQRSGTCRQPNQSAGPACAARQSPPSRRLLARIADLRAWLFLVLLLIFFETWARFAYGVTLPVLGLQSAVDRHLRRGAAAAGAGLDLRHHLRRHRPVDRLHHGPVGRRRRACHQPEPATICRPSRPCSSASWSAWPSPSCPASSTAC